MATKIRNIGDLINDLSNAYEMLRDKEMSLGEAKEVANLGGKLIKAASMQLKYNQYMKILDKIPFLESAAAVNNVTKKGKLAVSLS